MPYLASYQKAYSAVPIFLVLADHLANDKLINIIDKIKKF